MIEVNAVCVDEHCSEPGSPKDMRQEAREEISGFARISLCEPTEEEIAEVRRGFGLRRQLSQPLVTPSTMALSPILSESGGRTRFGTPRLLSRC